MAVKQLETAFIRDVASVWKTIQDGASGKIVIDPGRNSPRTCWNAVGLYLRENPQTRGIVWFYGPPGSEVSDVVYHVVLTDRKGNVLRDTMQKMGGKPVKRCAYYQLPGGSEDAMEMMAWKKWSPKG